MVFQILKTGSPKDKSQQPSSYFLKHFRFYEAFLLHFHFENLIVMIFYNRFICCKNASERINTRPIKKSRTHFSKIIGFYNACFLKSVGVFPVYFLKDVLNEDLELKPTWYKISKTVSSF